MSKLKITAKQLEQLIQRIIKASEQIDAANNAASLLEKKASECGLLTKETMLLDMSLHALYDAPLINLNNALLELVDESQFSLSRLSIAARDYISMMRSWREETREL